MPRNMANNLHIYEAMKGRNVDMAFIGARRGKGSLKTKFYSVGGVELSFTNWYPKEPNNENEGCVEIIYKTNYKSYQKNGTQDFGGKWNDKSCGTSRRYICQLSLEK